MIFNEHSRLAGKHATLSASQHSWLNYSEDKLIERLTTMEAAARGTRLHQLAHDLIREGQKLPSKPATTMAMYVNDAIGYMMKPEQILYVSENCFGTADAISFTRGKLRIHDLKTGVSQPSIHQLEVYAAMFCMEYDIKPYEIEMELRLYFQNERMIFDADPEDIVKIIGTIKRFDPIITKRRQEERA